MKPLTHEAKLAKALHLALREMQHVKLHGFQCAALDSAIQQARKALDDYRNE